MSEQNYTHVAFSDDSNHSSKLFRSLCLVSLTNDNYNYLLPSLKKILRESGVLKEFKWSKVRNAKYRFAAEKIIRFIFTHQDKLRIDTIIWNMDDSRHNNVISINNEENLVRMYYHLFSCVTSKRWPTRNVSWVWYPDIQSSVNWDLLGDCIVNKKHSCLADIFNPHHNFNQVSIKNINPSKSHDFYFIQVADLFAGIGAYSFGEFSNYEIWEISNSPQTDLFKSNLTDMTFSPSQEEKFNTIKLLNNMCKSNKLSVALDSTKGFKSHNPKAFLNFWTYEPQHDMDKAPKRQ
jgi:hypothetical protein